MEYFNTIAPIYVPKDVISHGSELKLDFTDDKGKDDKTLSVDDQIKSSCTSWK